MGKTGISEIGSLLVELPCPAQHSDGSLHPHSWVVGNWSRCSRSCDAGVRSRSVVCQRRVSAAEEKALDDSACPQPRPPVLEACQGPMCPPEWAALEWSEVSCHLSSHPGTGLSVWGKLLLKRSCSKPHCSHDQERCIVGPKASGLWAWSVSSPGWSQPGAGGKACG